MKKYLLLLVFIGCAGFAHAQQDSTLLTLQQCLDIAVKNNLTVKQSGLTAEQDRIGLNQAKENLIPSLTANAGRYIDQGRGINPITNTYVNQSLTSDSYGLNANVTVFNGLTLQNLMKEAALAYQAGKMDFQQAKDQVTINVITNYLSILDGQEQLNQAKNALEVAKQTVDRLEILEKLGSNKPTDLSDATGVFAADQVSAVVAQNSLDGAKVSLFQIMNIPYNRKAQFQPLNAAELDGDYGVTPDQVYQSALQQLPLVKSAELKRQVAEKNLKVYKGYLLPTVTLGGGLNTSYSSASQNVSYINQFRNNYQSNIGITLNIPIFTNWTRRNNISLAKINLLNYQYIEDNTKVQLKQSIEQAYYNMIAAYNKYKALLNEVKAYTESFRISKIRFEAGILNSVDYVTAKNNMDNASLSLISAKYDYFIDSKVIDYYQGKMAF